jgi:hypothetical protein
LPSQTARVSPVTPRVPSDYVGRAELHARFLDVEARRRLLEYSVDGWSVWPLLRKAVFDRLSPNRRTGNQRTRARPLWSQVLRDTIGLFHLRNTGVLVKTYTSGLLDEADGGRLRDIWFDDLVLGRSDAMKIEEINNRSLLPVRSRALNPSAFTTTLFDLLSRGVAPRLNWSPEIDKTSGELSEVIAAELGVTFPSTAVRSVLAHFALQRRLYSMLLRRVKPHTVIVVDFGEYGLVAAARALGIRVFEMQHGIADRYHPAYTWGPHATPYRDRMPIADRMLLFGEFWKQELSHSDFWSGCLDVVGSSRCDRYRAIPRTSGTGPYRVLVTADGVESTETIRLLKEFLSAAEGVELEVIIKLHPILRESDEPIRRAFSGEARVSTRAATEGDSTFRLLRAVDLHVSISSASHYDALGLGTPTAILKAANYGVVAHLVELGHASLVTEGGQLVERLKARSSPVPREVSEFYFRSGAVNNISRVIEQRA